MKNHDKKRPKIECEICGCKNTEILHRHHIIEKCKINSDDSDWNTAIICPNCHNEIHSENPRIKIIGVFPSTSISGKILVYIKDGVSNVPDMENEKPYYTPKPLSMKVFNKEDNS